MSAEKPWLDDFERKTAAMAAVDREAAALLRTARRDRKAGDTVVYTVRLDRAEFDALERRAALLRVRPSVLARNLIRIGLCRSLDEVRAEALDRLADAVAEVQALTS